MLTFAQRKARPEALTNGLETEERNGLRIAALEVLTERNGLTHRLKAWDLNMLGLGPEKGPACRKAPGFSSSGQVLRSLGVTHLLRLSCPLEMDDRITLKKGSPFPGARW